MLSKEEFQRTYIRMMDSLRDPLNPNLKGRSDCKGVCCDCCPLNKLDDGKSTTCSNMTYVAMDVIEIVEQWGKDHPVMTNGDKFREVFGRDPLDGTHKYDHYYTAFWGSEYIPPKKED